MSLQYLVVVLILSKISHQLNVLAGSCKILYDWT